MDIRVHHRAVIIQSTYEKSYFKPSNTTSRGKMVKTLPFSDIQVPSPGFGAMGISHAMGSNLSLEEAEPVLLKAIELGCTFWDTAVSEWRFVSYLRHTD
jgi:hypothetical protein